MSEQKVIPIDKTAIPYRFDIQLSGEIFTFEVHYNARFDYFTLHVERDGAVIVYGEKIVYGRPLFAGLNDSRLPKTPVVPTDVARIETRVGWDQMGETVFLFVSEADSA